MIEIKQPKLVVVEGGKGQQDPIDLLKRIPKAEESDHAHQAEAFIRCLEARQGGSNEAA